MKLTIRDLRSLIQESLEDLDERAMTSADAGDDLALYVKQQHDRVDVVLYRVKEMQQDFAAGYSPKTLQKHIVAVLSASESSFDVPYFEVTMSAAEKGWGPFVYDIAMELAGGLMPDRGSVSPDARRIWEGYNKRSDVQSESLERYHVRLHHDEVLDQGYKLKSAGTNVDFLRSRHDDDLSSNVWDAARRYASARTLAHALPG